MPVPPWLSWPRSAPDSIFSVLSPQSLTSQSFRTSNSSYKNRFHCLNGTPKRLDKADLWEDVEAGLESINPISPRGNNRSIRLIPLAKTSCLRIGDEWKERSFTLWWKTKTPIDHSEARRWVLFLALGNSRFILMVCIFSNTPVREGWVPLA